VYHALIGRVTCSEAHMPTNPQQSLRDFVLYDTA
jgi:hypothetical protein